MIVPICSRVLALLRASDAWRISLVTPRPDPDNILRRWSHMRGVEEGGILILEVHSPSIDFPRKALGSSQNRDELQVSLDTESHEDHRYFVSFHGLPSAVRGG